MIVLDASVVVELLSNEAGWIAGVIRQELATRGDSFIAPHLLDVEVVSAFRGLAAGQRIDAYRVGEFIMDLNALPVNRFPHSALLSRIWGLRHNFTCYDAAYIALAEATNSLLYTCDAKLSKGHRARVVLFTNGHVFGTSSNPSA